MRRAALLFLGLVALTGCEGAQSVLDPAGEDASRLATLFWVMAAGACVIWIGVNGLFYFVWRRERHEMSPRAAEGVIVGGGVVFPAVVLAGLLFYTLSMVPELRAPGNAGEVRVTGEQWWWRVEYPGDGGGVVTTANEVVLPVGARTEITLAADRVIHSFWIPVLGGKTDMIPGRVTRMSLAPTETGLFRGQCTEFCGESHAWMAFSVRVLEPAAFDDWLAFQRSPAVAPATEAARRGRELFLAEGCGACHTLRGTEAAGRVGPDLTHLASRATLAAGALPMTKAALARWVKAPADVKPGALMPDYDHLSDAEIGDLAAYLAGLE